MRFSQGDAVFAYLYGQGTQYRAYYSMGAHCIRRKKSQGVYFSTWAPFARSVSVVGDFNGWDPAAHPMNHLGITGLWELFIENLPEGALYKYAVVGEDGVTRLKADPYGFASELRPNTASVVYDLGNYDWKDGEYMARLRSGGAESPARRPVNIYEVHLTSWLEACTDEAGIDLGRVGEKLAQYAKDMHYTHIELLPIMEHPLDASWGYQLLGFYAATARLGQPSDVMAFIDACHAQGIGVILDWVPGHFCKDAPGLYEYDGTPLYGWEDHPHWGTQKFNYAYRHVWSFLISNALFWVDMYHADGLRIDGMASMIDLNYGRDTQRRNRDGGTEDIEAIEFLRKLNDTLVNEYPGVLLFAEDSSTHPGVTRPVSEGGLGFHFKWNMGWMNDTLEYMKLDPIYRSYHHDKMTFAMMYAFSERFVLSLSHDEVVHGKLSLIGRMPGDYEQKFANLRNLMCWQMFHPGKKLLFMGSEFAQFIEWRFNEPLEWFLLDYPMHACMQRFVRDLNAFYLDQAPLWALDDSWEGFRWIDANNAGYSVFSFRRIDADGRELICVLNMTPHCHEYFSLGVTQPGVYEEIFNSDRARYGGQGRRNAPVKAYEELCFDLPYKITFQLPGLTSLVFALTQPQSQAISANSENIEEQERERINNAQT